MDPHVGMRQPSGRLAIGDTGTQTFDIAGDAAATDAFSLARRPGPRRVARGGDGFSVSPAGGWRGKAGGKSAEWLSEAAAIKAR